MPKNISGPRITVPRRIREQLRAKPPGAVLLEPKLVADLQKIYVHKPARSYDARSATIIFDQVRNVLSFYEHIPLDSGGRSRNETRYLQLYQQPREKEYSLTIDPTSLMAMIKSPDLRLPNGEKDVMAYFSLAHEADIARVSRQFLFPEHSGETAALDYLRDKAESITNYIAQNLLPDECFTGYGYERSSPISTVRELIKSLRLVPAASPFSHKRS